MISDDLAASRSEAWLKRLQPYRKRLKKSPELVVEGKLSRMVGLTLEAVGCRSATGGRCVVEAPDGKRIEAEVVG
ncbi:MAG: flagellum-specific ATP synthase FliI, partial [Gammaproteobacteria bacterium]